MGDECHRGHFRLCIPRAMCGRSKEEITGVKKLPEIYHLLRVPSNSGEVFLEDKWCHLESDAWRWTNSDYRLHRWVIREWMCGPIWFVAVRSGEDRSMATFWRASWWAWKDKTTNGLPPPSGAIQTKDGFNEKPSIPLRKQRVAED